MNCANHPDVVNAAYCQNCGKPLCTACVRSVGGVVYCEPCLAARLSSTGANPGVPYTGLHAHPLLAGLLGFIPGVGAMYNGQFVKALAHVLIFAVFVSLADKSDFFGLLVAAWIFYQVFDAAQTAKARRDGLPLPNPFGLNDLGPRLGLSPHPPYVQGFAPPPPPPGTWADPAAGPAPGSAPDSTSWTPGPATGPTPGPAGAPGPDPAAGWNAPPSGYTASYAAPPAGPGPAYSSVGQPAYPSANRQRPPVGAIVLIGVGVLLLLNTLGVFEGAWLGRVWPVILIVIGGWLFYRRTRDNQDSGPRGGF